MTPLLEKLPTILVLAVLVGIFLSLRKHAPSARIRLWTYAWAFIFLHFFIQAFETHTGTLETIIESIDIAALELSGVVFVTSMIQAVEIRSKRRGLLALLGIPVAFHAVAASFNWHIPVTMSAALAVIFFGGAGFALLARPRPQRFNVGVAVVLIAAGVWAVHEQLHGSADFGITAILTLSFGLCGLLFWKRYPRASSGVIAVSGGFLAWGAVFPLGAAFDYFWPKLQMNPEIWNVPKYFVAFGMVLTLLEDKSRIVEQSSAREHAENLLLQRLSHITSRLLAGKDPAALCNEVAVAVTDASSFSKAALLLASEDRSFHLAGANGFSIEETNALEERARVLTIEQLKNTCDNAPKLGSNSYRIADPHNEVLIPLISWRGSYVGCLFLRCENAAGPDVSEMVKLEVLASDLAVTIENTRLHHQLVRAEKLAALGQLVAGVAHELNNPLTGIIGYSELLAEEVQGEKVVKRLQKLGVEAHRMKRIVDGLLRFARQNNPATRAADLDGALRDVIQLREYHLRKMGIKVESHLDPKLPPIAIGEDELKQVLLNLLNNSMDAVQDSAQRVIQIRASRHQNTVVIQFEDSGPGFVDLNRAFDPFFTTKPVGQGTGLGLAISYGIMQDHGGSIEVQSELGAGTEFIVKIPLNLKLVRGK